MMTKINNWFINFYKKLFEIAGKYWGINVTVLLLIVVGFVILAFIFGWGWTGFFAYSTGPQDHPGKTLWDVLSLAVIPLALVLIAYIFNKRQKESELEIAKEERKLERRIAQDRVQETALQNYLDKMTELLLKENLRESGEGSEVRGIARARTLTVLRGLDGNRKGSLIQFLYEADIVSIINLEGADLSRANLSEAELPNIKLSGVNLSEANLYKTNLDSADLSGANLREAILKNASLFLTDLSEANLLKAYLVGAYLQAADLRKANLAEANLTGVILQNTDLGAAKLDGAKMSGADLSGATLRGVDLRKARHLGSGNNFKLALYDSNTKWPDNIDPQKAGARYAND